MRRIIILITILQLIFTGYSIADDNTPITIFGFAPMVATHYIKWTRLLDVSDFEYEYNYSDVDANNEKTLFVDDLAISIDNTSLYPTWIGLFYIDDQTKAIDIIEKWKRASAFFGALEYGDPDNINPIEMNEIKTEIEKIVSDLNNTMFKYRGLFSRDNEMTFYLGKKATFTITYLEDDQQWIIGGH